MSYVKAVSNLKLSDVVVFWGFIWVAVVGRVFEIKSLLFECFLKPKFSRVEVGVHWFEFKLSEF